MDRPEAPDDMLVRLRLDGGGTITAVNDAFDRFACDNDTPQISGRSVIGRKLDDFITGDETRMFIAVLVKGALVLRRESVRLYRCDSADTRRLMEMRIAPLPEGGVDMLHRLVWQERLQHRTAFTAVGRVVAMAKRCSICNRLQMEGSWHEPDQLARPDPSRPIKVFYGICDECQADPVGRTLETRWVAARA